MIESCSIKRMLIGFSLLGGLTIIVLIVESSWTTQKSLNIIANNTKNCWEREKYEVLEDCHPCTQFEIASNSIDACSETKFKEAVKCEISGKAFRSCEKVTWIEERHFWVFESVMFAVAVLSWCVVIFRQNILDRRVKSRLQKQLTSGLYN